MGISVPFLSLVTIERPRGPAAKNVWKADLSKNASNLVDFNNLNLLSGTYWSSTERALTPSLSAWIQFFGGGGTGSQGANTKSFSNTVRCSRSLTPKVYSLSGLF